MKIYYKGSKLKLVFVILLILILVSATAFAQRRGRAGGTQPVEEEKVGIAGQFLGSTICIFSCGWPAIVLITLPPLGIYIFKKYWSWG